MLNLCLQVKSTMVFPEYFHNDVVGFDTKRPNYCFPHLNACDAKENDKLICWPLLSMQQNNFLSMFGLVCFDLITPQSIIIESNQWLRCTCDDYNTRKVVFVYYNKQTYIHTCR